MSDYRDMSAAARNSENQLSLARELVCEVSLPARDRLELRLKVSAEDVIESAVLKVAGCSELLHQVTLLRPLLRGKLADLALPEGADHGAMLIRELLLKAQGRWNPPYTEDEICHCRGVATAKVDRAIVGGCHSVESIKRMTSAGTSCGTCRWDVNSLIKYRLGTASGTGFGV